MKNITVEGYIHTLITALHINYSPDSTGQERAINRLHCKEQVVMCSRFPEEGGHLDPVWIYQEVSGIMSSIVHTGNPCWRLRLGLVLIRWVAARHDRVESLPRVGIRVLCGHSEKPVVLRDRERGGVQFLDAEEGDISAAPVEQMPASVDFHRHFVVVIGEQEGCPRECQDCHSISTVARVCRAGVPAGGTAAGWQDPCRVDCVSEHLYEDVVIDTCAISKPRGPISLVDTTKHCKHVPSVHGMSVPVECCNTSVCGL